MTGLAALVLAHQDPPQVRRLLRALGDVPVFLHCDVKADADVARGMLDGAGPHVHALPRTSGSLGSWSLVRIELDGLREAVRRTTAEHVLVLTGSDYPLVGLEELQRRLEPWRDRSYLLSVPVPFAAWSSSRHPDGGRWRTERRFLRRGDDLLVLRGVPLRFPWARRLPAELRVRASSQWKVYARADVERLLHVVDTRPDLVAFWRSTLVPDESFAASTLASPALVGEAAAPECHDVPWFLRWGPPGTYHPEWLGPEDFDALVAARSAPPGLPEELQKPPTGPKQALFARKFSTARSADLLDRVDAELRV